MKTCALVIGDDTKTAMATAYRMMQKIYLKAGAPVKEMTIVGAAITMLDQALRQGAPMPEMFVEADARMLLGVGGRSTLYLEQVQDELERQYCASMPERAPTFLWMSDVVVAECRRRSLERVWIQSNMPSAKTDFFLDEKLREAGLNVCDMEAPETNHILWQILSKLANTKDAAETTALVDEFRGLLSGLAECGDFQAVILDRLAFPFIEAERLSASWGPEYVDGFTAYLDAAVDWIYDSSKSPPPR